MNLHEQIDWLLARSPRTKLITAAITAVVVISILLFAGWIGARLEHGWSTSKHIRENEKYQRIIEKHQENERQLAAENAFLIKQNEAAAEILIQSDKKLEGDAKLFTILQEKRNEKIQLIDLDNNFDSQLCGLCSDSKRAGFQLSDAICGRCKSTP